MHRRFQDAKMYGLVIVAGLAVAYVRHKLQPAAWPWESYEGFFVSWFTHTVGVALFCAISAVAISMSHEFFLGYKFDEKYQFNDKFQQVMVYITIAVVVASVCVLMIGTSRPD